jgi:hypothetical protein
MVQESIGKIDENKVGNELEGDLKPQTEHSERPTCPKSMESTLRPLMNKPLPSVEKELEENLLVGNIMDNIEKIGIELESDL